MAEKHEPSVNDIPDNELVGRIVRNIRSRARTKTYRWAVMSELFALGSGYSKQLCRRYGKDPDELIRWPVRIR